MFNIYQKKIKLLAEHVDYKRQLRLNTLMHLFQEASIAHTEELGMGRKMTLDRGFLWVIANERIQINRLPEYDEEITIISYPGKTMRSLFPRYFQILDKDNNVIIKGTSIWTLINQKTREMIEPDKYGIHIEGKEKGDELMPILNIITPTLNNKSHQRVTYSKVDLNGHMNNANYVDLALDLIDEDYLVNNNIKEIDLQFKKEIKFREEFDLDYSLIDNSFYMSCPNFKLKFIFR